MLVGRERRGKRVQHLTLSASSVPFIFSVDDRRACKSELEREKVWGYPTFDEGG